MPGQLFGTLPVSWKLSSYVDWMKKKISVIVGELGVASADDVALILREHSGEVNRKTLSTKLRGLEKAGVIFKVLPKESPYSIEGYIGGPNLDAEDDFEIRRLVAEHGPPPRDIKRVDWKSFSSRVIGPLLDELDRLREDLEKGYEDPKNIEMRYFDLSVRYHEFYGFFFDRCGVGFLSPVENSLKECKNQLDRKEI